MVALGAAVAGLPTRSVGSSPTVEAARGRSRQPPPAGMARRPRLFTGDRWHASDDWAGRTRFPCISRRSTRAKPDSSAIVLTDICPSVSRTTGPGRYPLFRAHGCATIFFRSVPIRQQTQKVRLSKAFRTINGRSTNGCNRGVTP